MPCHQYALAIKDNFWIATHWLAPRLGLDGEHTRRPYHDVVEVKSFSDHIMEHLITFLPKPLKILADGLLTFARQS